MAGGIDSYVVLMLHFDGSDGSTTFTDSSTAQAPKTMTAVGNGQIDTSDSVFGGASYLGDGTGDGMTTPYSADFDLGTTGSGHDWTIDFRAKLAGTGDTFFAGNSNGAAGWLLEYFSGNIYLGVSTTTVAWTPTANTWYHIAVVKSGATITLYVDGTSQGNFGSDVDMSLDSMTMSLCYRQFNGAGSLNGWMDEMRISKGIARWTANFTPPTEAYSSAGSSRLSLLSLLGCG